MKYISLSRKIDTLNQSRKYHFTFFQINHKSLYQFYILLFKDFSNCVTFVFLHVFLIMFNNITYQNDDIISFINDLFSNFQFFVIRYKIFF